MTIRVLIVDDSKFICKRIQQILEEDEDFKVVGVASNGKEALVLAAQLEPDVITMDVEMPIMDGISAVKKIMADCPTAILMFSAATHRGAQATLDALNAGAIDFLPKQLNEIDGNKEMAKRLLRSRVRTVASQAKKVQKAIPNTLAKVKYSSQYKVQKEAKQAQNVSVSKSSQIRPRKIELLVIVASTGGPVAIQRILTHLSASCSFPIIIVQHMPQNFTKSFAERLNQRCKIKVKEAENGDILSAGEALLGPGGMQIEIKKGIGKKTVLIRDKKKDEIYSPCADITLASIAETCSANVLTVVLTGMGADGKEGAVKLKQKGVSIWAQDEQSCTIYGMPRAIIEGNLADKVFSLDEIENQFKKIS